MSKINRTFRLDDLVDKKLAKLAEFYSLKNMSDGVVAKKVSKTDILEYLVSDRFTSLKLDGYDIDLD